MLNFAYSGHYLRRNAHYSLPKEAYTEELLAIYGELSFQKSPAAFLTHVKGMLQTVPGINELRSPLLMRLWEKVCGPNALSFEQQQNVRRDCYERLIQEYRSGEMVVQEDASGETVTPRLIPYFIATADERFTEKLNQQFIDLAHQLKAALSPLSKNEDAKLAFLDCVIMHLPLFSLFDLIKHRKAENNSVKNVFKKIATIDYHFGCYSVRTNLKRDFDAECSASGSSKIDAPPTQRVRVF